MLILPENISWLIMAGFENYWLSIKYKFFRYVGIAPTAAFSITFHYFYCLLPALQIFKYHKKFNDRKLTFLICLQELFLKATDL